MYGGWSRLGRASAGGWWFADREWRAAAGALGAFADEVARDGVHGAAVGARDVDGHGGNLRLR